MSRLRGYLLEQVRFELEDAVGAERVVVATEELENVGIDQYWLTFMWQQRGAEQVLPQFIVSPTSTEQVAKVMRICDRHRLPVVVRGGGSGTQGGASTPYGGVVLDLLGMDRVIELDVESSVVTVEAGINGAVLEEWLNERGLMLSHYPSSAALSTAGGYVAARGSGVMSTKYGKAEDMVLSLEMVLADGSIVDTLTVPNHASGPGLLQLFVGSEGTLGIITRVTFRVDPLPEVRLFRTFSFDTVEQGIAACQQAMLQRLQPAVMRLYDPAASTRSLTATGHDVDESRTNLIVMVDGHDDVAAPQMARLIQAAAAQGGADHGPDGGQHWWEHRYDFYRPPLMPAYPMMYGTLETVTTFRNLPALYRAKKELVETEFADWNAQYTAHFSHWFPWGGMIYDRFYIENPPEDPREALRLHNRVWAAASRVNLAYEGALNEHHGIGLKLGWLMPELSPGNFDVLAKIKNVLDPKGLLNPGKLGFGV